MLESFGNIPRSSNETGNSVATYRHHKRESSKTSGLLPATYVRFLYDDPTDSMPWQGFSYPGRFIGFYVGKAKGGHANRYSGQKSLYAGDPGSSTIGVNTKVDVLVVEDPNFTDAEICAIELYVAETLSCGRHGSYLKTEKVDVWSIRTLTPERRKTLKSYASSLARHVNEYIDELLKPESIAADAALPVEQNAS